MSTIYEEEIDSDQMSVKDCHYIVTKDDYTTGESLALGAFTDKHNALSFMESYVNNFVDEQDGLKDSGREIFQEVQVSYARRVDLQHHSRVKLSRRGSVRRFYVDPVDMEKVRIDSTHKVRHTTKFLDYGHFITRRAESVNRLTVWRK